MTVLRFPRPRVTQLNAELLLRKEQLRHLEKQREKVLERIECIERKLEKEYELYN